MTPAPEPELHTDRLLLRAWRPEDEEGLVEIVGDATVNEFLNFESPASYLAESQTHWRDHGFGHFAVEARVAPFRGELIGLAGVVDPSCLPREWGRPELGWGLARRAWGVGFATEATLAAREDAFDRLRLRELISVIHCVNDRSQRVAEKLGMAVEERRVRGADGRDSDIWSLHSGEGR